MQLAAAAGNDEEAVLLQTGDRQLGVHLQQERAGVRDIQMVSVVTLPPWVSMWHSTVRPGLGTAPAVATSSSCAESGPVRENFPKLETGVGKVDTCLVVDIQGESKKSVISKVS